jgi:hypothetical protein
LLILQVYLNAVQMRRGYGKSATMEVGKSEYMRGVEGYSTLVRITQQESDNLRNNELCWGD